MRKVGGFLTPDDAPTDELRTEYEALLRAAGLWPLQARPLPEEPPDLAALIDAQLDAQCELLGDQNEQIGRGAISAPLRRRL